MNVEEKLAQARAARLGKFFLNVHRALKQ